MLPESSSLEDGQGEFDRSRMFGDVGQAQRLLVMLKHTQQPQALGQVTELFSLFGCDDVGYESLDPPPGRRHRGDAQGHVHCHFGGFIDIFRRSGAAHYAGIRPSAKPQHASARRSHQLA